MSSKSKPLALGNTLRDLALLRVSNVDLSSFLPVETSTSAATESPEVSVSAARSHEFVDEARAALKVYNSGELQKKRAEVQKVQGELDEVLRGLS
ncbi:hypothetical protein BU15DRAFT_53802 [Melanogaster broomeanus]|nr:hypothetical protein BU15DRAFT_53802 [Melanogaster broomeanus]